MEFQQSINGKKNDKDKYRYFGLTCTSWKLGKPLPQICIVTINKSNLDNYNNIYMLFLNKIHINIYNYINYFIYIYIYLGEKKIYIYKIYIIFFYFIFIFITKYLVLIFIYYYLIIIKKI